MRGGTEVECPVVTALLRLDAVFHPCYHIEDVLLQEILRCEVMIGGTSNIKPAPSILRIDQGSSCTIQGGVNSVLKCVYC